MVSDKDETKTPKLVLTDIGMFDVLETPVITMDRSFVIPSNASYETEAGRSMTALTVLCVEEL